MRFYRLRSKTGDNRRTTIFNALTKGNATVASYSNNPNIGVAKVPDVRLDALSRMYMPKKTVAAEVVYTEVPPPPDEFGKTKGIGGDFLNAIQATDALLIVSRAFIDPSVAHVEDTIDSVRDTENMIMELNFSDIEILDRRLNKIEAGFKSAKSIVKIKLTKNMPNTAWKNASPREYGFYSNVNPEVDHPRWSQATERVIGESILAPRIKTLMFNGYGDEVAHLYSGMDLKKNY